MMDKTNFIQHEQHLKHLESSVREICETCVQAERFVKETWHLSMALFAVAEDLRQTSLEIEKAHLFKEREI